MSKEDPVERIVRQTLERLDIAYTRDNPLDFECAGFAIECKQFATPRTAGQIGDRTDVILIHGLQAARAFAALMIVSETKGKPAP